MKTLTDIVCALVDMMEAKEQDEYLAAMAQGKRPTKPPRPQTKGEIWWYEKLNLRHAKEWITDITPSDLLDDYIERTGWTRSRHGAATSMGVMLKKLCPDIRRYDDKYTMPGLDQARKAYTDVFPAPRRTLGESGNPPKVLKAIMLD